MPADVLRKPNFNGRIPAHLMRPEHQRFYTKLKHAWLFNGNHPTIIRDNWGRVNGVQDGGLPRSFDSQGGKGIVGVGGGTGNIALDSAPDLGDRKTLSCLAVFRTGTYAGSNDPRVVRWVNNGSTANILFMDWNNPNTGEEARLFIDAGATLHSVVLGEAIQQSRFYTWLGRYDGINVYSHLYDWTTTTLTEGQTAATGDTLVDVNGTFNIGGNTGSAREWDGNIYSVIVWNDGFDVATARWLLMNPYKWLEPAPYHARWKVAVVGGLSIPVAMYAYRQRHQSVA